MAPNEPEKWGCRMRIRDLFSKISRLIQYYETKKTTGAPASAAPASLVPMKMYATVETLPCKCIKITI